jgi:lipoprotein-anchoring transpeptidase ErfK/SrfK
MSINIKSAFVVLFVLTIFIISLPLALSRITQSGKSAGCRALTDTGEINPQETLAIWQNRTINPLLSLRETLTADQKRVLGVTTVEKWIEIDLSDQKLTAHQGDTVFLTSPISSGLWNKTPIGEYRIWYKIKSTKMEGGNKLNNTYYYLPNVPYDMFFYGDYGIHGTYWHSNFGHPMSHGCVNAPTPIAERLFYWTDPQLPDGTKVVKSTSDNPGTRVVVHE